MKCRNCNKTIPNNSLICSYCGKDPTTFEQVEFGTINDQIYDNKMDIKVFIKDPKNHKKFFVVVGLGFLSIIIIIGLILSFINMTKVEPYQIYNGFINKVNELLVERIDNVYQGKYNLEVDTDKDDYLFDGEYSYDLSNRYITLTGKYEDPIKKQGGIILEQKDLDFELFYNEISLLFDSKSISPQTLLLPLDNFSLYLSKKVDYSSLLTGYAEALGEGFKNVNFITEQVNYKFKNQNLKLNKISVKFDNKEYYHFVKAFYNYLIDDSSIMSEIAKITKTKEDELINTFNNYIDNAKLAENEKDKNFFISIYAKGKNIYEINYNDELKFSIVDNNYYLKLYKDGNTYLDFMISNKEEEHLDYIEKIYDYDLTLKGSSYKGFLKVKDNIEPNLNKYNLSEYKSVNDLTDENKVNIKNSFNYYFKTSDFVDVLFNLVKEKCNKGMNCTCEDTTTCTCVYNNKMISCDYNLVN